MCVCVCVCVCIKFIFNVFLAVLGLCCCLGFSLAVVSRGYSPAAACRLLIAVASLVAEQGFMAWGLSSCGVWDLPGSGVEPALSPALAGGLYHWATREAPAYIKNPGCIQILAIPSRNSPEFVLAFFFLSTLTVPFFGFHYLWYIVSYLLIPFSWNQFLNPAHCLPGINLTGPLALVTWNKKRRQ